jgi:hypothetical protein
MIRWKHVRPDREDSEAEAGPLLLMIGPGARDGSWYWSVGLVGGDGAELALGNAPSERRAKTAARRAVVRTIAKITRALRA